MRNISPWEPRTRFFNLPTGIDRLFSDVWRAPVLSDSGAESACGSWHPPVNILERESGIEITVEMPGIEAKDVEVTVDNGMLSIRGERILQETAEGETYHRVESSFGAFERRFTMPRSVDTGKIEARFKNGVMTLTLPKREESKARKLKIAVDSN